jgi:AcrR family transcriptional regulator
VPESPRGEGAPLTGPGAASGPGPARAAVGRRRATPGKRARLDPETRRAQLVEVALAELDRGGDAPFTVDDVADAAGVSRSLVYAYFGDRNGLVAEVYVNILDRLDHELGFDLPRDAGALRRVVGGCMSFAQANRAAWRMLVSDPSRQHPLVAAARSARAGRIARSWDGDPADTAGTADTIAAGDGTAASHLAAEAALGMLESGVLHWIDHPDVPVEQAAALLSTILWSGLTLRPPA